jgi:hypothetical protein
MDLAGSIIGKATRWLAAVNTQYNPAFGLANLTRDTWGGLVNLNSTPLRGRGLKVLADVPMAMRGHRAARWPPRACLGGEPGRSCGSSSRPTAAAPAGATPSGIRTSARGRSSGAQRLEHNGALNPRVLVTRTLLNLLDGFNTVLENAVRLAAYKEALDKGLSRPEAARLGASSRWTSTARAAAPASCRRCTPSSTPACRARAHAGNPQGAARQGDHRRRPAAGRHPGADAAGRGLRRRRDPGLREGALAHHPAAAQRRGQKRFMSVPYPVGLNVLPNTGRVLTELGLSGGKDLGKKHHRRDGDIAAGLQPAGLAATSSPRMAR